MRAQQGKLDVETRRNVYAYRVSRNYRKSWRAQFSLTNNGLVALVHGSERWAQRTIKPVSTTCLQFYGVSAKYNAARTP